MQKYKDFRPTAFDPKGYMLHDQQEWFVLGVSRNRDSSCLDNSNFDKSLEMLGGESETVEVHRFGHWGPGWFEIILINPTAADKVKVANDIEASLEDYPVLDEDDLCNREYEAACDYWEHMSIRERVELCQRFNIPFYEARHDYLPPSDNGSLYEYLTKDY